MGPSYRVRPARLGDAHVIMTRAISIVMILFALFVSGCAITPHEPQLRFHQILSMAGGTYAAFSLHNPTTKPIWIEGFAADEPLERWERLGSHGWEDAPGPFCATGTGPQLIRPNSTVWINMDVFPEDTTQTLRLGVRQMKDGAGLFTDGTDIIWSDAFVVHTRTWGASKQRQKFKGRSLFFGMLRVQGIIGVRSSPPGSACHFTGSL